jgi:hypothetical protein
MNGLRVYINQVSPEGTTPFDGQRVFYTRREDGPYYRWRYEEGLGQWIFSRVHASDLTPKALSIASWTAVPTALRARLSEHYLE